jgi:hypothetical protein
VYVQEYFALEVGAQYRDPEFAPCKESLGGFDKRSYEWRHLWQQYGNDFTLFPIENKHNKFEALPR